MKVKVTGIVSIFVLTLLVACKPDIKNETKKYNNNQISLKKFAAKYPAFRSQLVIVSQNAAKLMEESKKIDNEEQKAKKVAEANGIFTDSVVYRQLNSYDGRKMRIIELKQKLQRYTKRKHQSTVEDATEAANKGLSDSGKIMNSAKPATREEAEKILEEANGILINTEGTLNRALKKVKGKKKTFKRKKK